MDFETQKFEATEEIWELACKYLNHKYKRCKESINCQHVTGNNGERHLHLRHQTVGKNDKEIMGILSFQQK